MLKRAVCVIALIAILGAALALSSYSLPAPKVAMAQPAGWVELVRTPGGAYGPQSGAGKWRSLANTGFTGPGCSYRRYRPATGANASWWTEGYNDAAWSDTGYCSWQPAFPLWGFNPLPEIGNYVWTAAAPCCGSTYGNAIFDPLSTSLHRRTFTVDPAYVVSAARIKVFSDNISTFYVNGTLIAEHGGAAGTYAFAPAALHGGVNVLAVQLSNDCTPNNYMGLQYVLEVQYSSPTPTPTATATSTATATPTATATATATATNTSTPTATATSTATATATPTNTPTNTPTPTATPTPIPVALTLSADYPYLALRGPELPPPAGPLPAQVLRGAYSGPLPLNGRHIDIHIWDGSVWDTHTVFTNAAGGFLLTPAFASDPLLGTTLLGAWQAYAEVTVPGSGVHVSPDVSWRVNWFPVHGSK